MIHIITQRDPFFVDEFLREFNKSDIGYTIYNLPNFNGGKFKGLLKARSLYGNLGLIKLILLYLFKYWKTDLSNLEEQINLKDVEQLNEMFKSLDKTDIVLSLSAPVRIDIQHIPKSVTKLNFHCGKLPKYAGMMPIFWQLFAKEDEIVITAHDLADEIDTGEIYAELSFKAQGSLFQISQKAKRHTADLFVDLIKNPEKLKRIKVAERKNISLTKFPTRQEARKLRRERKLI